MTFNDFYDYLLNLCDKLSHRVDEQDETIEKYQKEIERLSELIDIRDDVCIDFSEEIKRLEKENTNLSKNIEYYQKEIKRLHQVFDIKDSARVELVKENKKLKNCLTIAENDYKNCYAENIRLTEKNNNLIQNIEHICDENVRLRHELNEVKNHDRNY